MIIFYTYYYHVFLTSHLYHINVYLKISYTLFRQNISFKVSVPSITFDDVDRGMPGVGLLLNNY